jgi:hypothetical protein
MPGIVDVPGVEVFGKGTGEYTLPCGYVDPQGAVHNTVFLRELTGTEEDMMDDDDVGVTERMSRVLASCCTKLGTITDAEIIGQAIADELAGGLSITSTDRIAMMIFLRRTSVGDVYKFSRRCPVCNHMNKNKALDLRTIEMTSVPTERASKRRVQITLPRSKRKAIMRVLTAKHEAKLTGLRPQQKDLKSLSILARVEAIECEVTDPADESKTSLVMKQLTDPKAGLELVKALPNADRNYMRQVFNAMEADVDTIVEVACDNRQCGAEFKFPLDMGQAFFLNPAEDVSAEALNWL